MILFSGIVCFTYTLLIRRFIQGFNKIKIHSQNTSTPNTKFSIIVAFRNEENNLPQLIGSLLKLNYPKPLYEVVLIDDHSEDDSYDTAIELTNSIANFRVSKSSQESKKRAITQAISKSHFDWIITTDADCRVLPNWLNCFDNHIQNNNTKIIAAPVKYDSNNSFLQSFQTLELLSLQGVTIGAFGLGNPIMCNGANLCYSRSVFEEVKGFEGNLSIASGDDTFLLNKIFQKYKAEVHFLFSEDAIVSTLPETNTKDLVNQRIRWSAKTTASKSLFTKTTAVLVLLMNVVFIYLLLKSYHFPLLAFILISTKGLIDFVIIRKTALFMEQKKALNNYLFSMFIYPFFSVYIALVSLFKGYTWKGRQLKK